MMNIFSYFYDCITKSTCNSCKCEAKYKGTPVTIYTSICNPEMIDVQALDKDGIKVQEKDEINVYSTTEECPIMDTGQPKYAVQIKQ